MKNLVIGTVNPSKVAQIKGALSPIKSLEVTGPEGKVPDVKEDGKTPQENARKKALAFAKALGTTVLSMDNALYFDDLEGDERQPGMNVRRFAGNNKRPTDQEMLEYYSNLIESLGGEINGRWEFAVCIATPDGNLSETTIISPRVFVSKASPKIKEGYPLESLQIDPVTKKYVSDMTKVEVARYWQRRVGKPLRKFVNSVI